MRAGLGASTVRKAPGAGGWALGSAPLERALEKSGSGWDPSGLLGAQGGRERAGQVAFCSSHPLKVLSLPTPSPLLSGGHSDCGDFSSPSATPQRPRSHPTSTSFLPNPSRPTSSHGGPSHPLRYPWSQCLVGVPVVRRHGLRFLLFRHLDSIF